MMASIQKMVQQQFFFFGNCFRLTLGVESHYVNDFILLIKYFSISPV